MSTTALSPAIAGEFEVRLEAAPLAGIAFRLVVLPTGAKRQMAAEAFFTAAEAAEAGFRLGLSPLPMEHLDGAPLDAAEQAAQAAGPFLPGQAPRLVPEEPAIAPLLDPEILFTPFSSPLLAVALASIADVLPEADRASFVERFVWRCAGRTAADDEIAEGMCWIALRAAGGTAYRAGLTNVGLALQAIAGRRALSIDATALPRERRLAAVADFARQAESHAATEIRALELSGIGADDERRDLLRAKRAIEDARIALQAASGTRGPGLLSAPAEFRGRRVPAAAEAAVSFARAMWTWQEACGRTASALADAATRGLLPASAPDEP